MHLMYFTEQPMSAYPQDAVGEDGTTALLFSNKHFDSVAGSRLYNDRLIEYKLAEEVGFDGIMLNEHHDAPFCMQAQITVWASILAAATERVKIVLPRDAVADAGEPAAGGGVAGDGGHDLQGPPRRRDRARGRHGAVRQQRQPRLQPRALLRGA